MLVCMWYTELTCIPYWAFKTDIVGQVLSPCVWGGDGIGACMLVCMWYTELTCIPYLASKTDIVGQVLGPSVCVSV